jgi:hypothetical protein
VGLRELEEQEGTSHSERKTGILRPSSASRTIGFLAWALDSRTMTPRKAGGARQSESF